MICNVSLHAVSFGKRRSAMWFDSFYSLTKRITERNRVCQNISKRIEEIGIGMREQKNNDFNPFFKGLFHLQLPIYVVLYISDWVYYLEIMELFFDIEYADKTEFREILECHQRKEKVQVLKEIYEK